MAGDNRCEISITAANNAKLEGRCLTQRKKNIQQMIIKQYLSQFLKAAYVIPNLFRNLQPIKINRTCPVVKGPKDSHGDSVGETRRRISRRADSPAGATGLPFGVIQDDGKWNFYLRDSGLSAALRSFERSNFYSSFLEIAG